MSYIEKRELVDKLKMEISLKGELNDPIKNKINYKFRLDWNYYSNSMEGNTLTKEETRSIMVGNITVEGKPIKDILEVKGHDEIISSILKIGKGEQRLSESKIKEIHKGIMHEENPDLRGLIGIWKKDPNYVLNYKGERFDYLMPEEVPERMHDLLNKTNAAIDAIFKNKKNAPHPIDVALQFHLDYVLIHPFYDGNGRTARILTNLLLISFGYPPFWIKKEEEKVYKQYLADIQGYGGSPNLFYEFGINLILRSQHLVFDAILGKEIEDIDDLDKEIELAKLELSSRKPKYSKRINKEHLKEFIKELAIPSILFLDQKTKPFEDEFLSIQKNISFLLNGAAININENSSIEEINTAISDKIDLEINLINHSVINYSKYFRGFKHNESAATINLGLLINFTEFYFELNTQHSEIKSIKVGYGEKVNIDLLLPILKTKIRYFMEERKGLLN